MNVEKIFLLPTLTICGIYIPVFSHTSIHLKNEIKGMFKMQLIKNHQIRVNRLYNDLIYYFTLIHIIFLLFLVLVMYALILKLTLLFFVNSSERIKIMIFLLRVSLLLHFFSITARNLFYLFCLKIDNINCNIHHIFHKFPYHISHDETC